MITLEKIIKETKAFTKETKKIPQKLYLRKEHYEDLKAIFGYPIEKLYGMKIIIGTKNGLE